MMRAELSLSLNRTGGARVRSSRAQVGPGEFALEIIETRIAGILREMQHEGIADRFFSPQRSENVSPRCAFRWHFARF